MGVHSLVMRRVLSRLVGEPGVLELVGWVVSFGRAFLEATVAPEY